MRRDESEVYVSTLFDAEIPDVANPIARRRPPPNVPLKREVRDAVEDTIEKYGVTDLSWGWAVWDIVGVGQRAVLILADCRPGGDATVGVALNDNIVRDVSNVRHYLLHIRSQQPHCASTTRTSRSAA